MDCFNCTHWVVASPTWEDPCGNEFCEKNRPEWNNYLGCELKEVQNDTK